VVGTGCAVQAKFGAPLVVAVLDCAQNTTSLFAVSMNHAVAVDVLDVLDAPDDPIKGM
jgi:hypothetical protein